VVADVRLSRGLALAAVGTGFALRWWTLATGEPLGTDSYYYVVQLEDYVATDALHVPDASWTLRVLAVPHALGLDAIAALAVGAAVLASLPSLVAAALDRDRGPWMAVALAASPTLTHLAADFPKSLGLAAPWLVAVGALDASRADRRWLLAALPALALTATAHRLGAVFAALSVLGAVAGGGWAGVGERQRWVRWVLAATVVSGIGALGFLGMARSTPGLLHPDDLERIGALATGRPPPWSWWSARPDTSWVQSIELLLPWVAVLVAPAAWRRRPVMAGACLLPLLATLAPVYPPDVLDLGYRVHLFSPLFAAPLLALALPDKLLDPRGLALGMLLLPAAAWGPAPSTTPPYPLYRAVLDGIPEPYPDLLVAHQGMNFLYDHRTGREAMAWAPDPGFPDARVRRVAYGILPGEWLEVFQDGDPDVVPLGHGYHLVGEPTWRRLVEAAEDDPELAARIADWRNPTRTRPAYLLGRRDGVRGDAPADR
jgi:hypothetical protein